MKIHFITYSNGELYTKIANNLVYQASLQFDGTKHYSVNDIQNLIHDNLHLWSHKKGDGFWIWKPYILLDYSSQVDEGDIIVYCDARYGINGDIYNPIKNHFIENDNEDIFVIKTHHFVSSSIQYELMWSKGDAFHLIGVDINDQRDPYQIWSGFICLKKSKNSIHIIDQWLEYCQDERIITDNVNIFQNNHISFIENRYDQTVLSLVLKKNKISMKESTLSNLLSGNPHSKLINRIHGT